MVYEKESEVTIGKIITWIFFGFICLMAIIAVFSTFYVIGAGERGIILTWGKVDMVAKQPGLHLKIPFAQTVKKMDIQTMKYDADASAASKDLQIVHAKIAVNYHLIPEGVPDLYKNIGMTYEQKIIQPAVQEVVKSATALFSAEELITKRGDVKIKIDELLHTRLSEKGIILETTSITNFDFSEEFNKAIESKVTAQQTALKAENDLTRIKIEKEQTITQAEATAASIKLKADADAYSLQVIREQLEKNSVLIQYKSIEKWNGILPVYMFGGNTVTPFVQIPTGNSTQ